MERTKYVPRSFRLSWSAIWPNLVWTCILVVRGVRVWAIKLNLTKCKTLYRSERFGDIVHHQVSEVSDIPPFIFLGDHNCWQRSHCIYFQVASICCTGANVNAETIDLPLIRYLNQISLPQTIQELYFYWSNFWKALTSYSAFSAYLGIFPQTSTTGYKK